MRRLGMVAILLGVGVWTILDYLNKGYQYGEDFNEHVRYCLNKFGIFVLCHIALVILVRAIVARSRRLVADEKGIGYAGKPPRSPGTKSHGWTRHGSRARACYDHPRPGPDLEARRVRLAQFPRRGGDDPPARAPGDKIIR